jgi:hypothetical protein
VCELRLGERMIVNLFCPHNSPGIIFRLAGRRTERSGVRERKKKKHTEFPLRVVGGLIVPPDTGDLSPMTRAYVAPLQQ